MQDDHPSRTGPYERAVRRIIGEASTLWWPEKPVLTLGCPPWLAARLAGEAGADLRVSSGSTVMTTLRGLTVMGCPNFDGPGSGRLTVHDLLNGWWYELPTRCHPDVVPSRWRDLTLALSDGLNPYAAVELASIGAS
jgi:hypothetical protein